VHEVNRPPRKGERRLSGKSDLIDAEHAARQVLGGRPLAIPKTGDGQVESLRLLKVARDTAVKARTAAMIALKATLVTADDELRARLEPLTDHRLITACAALGTAADLDEPDAAMRHVLSSMALRWLQLHQEITAHSRHLKRLTQAAAPRMLELVGVGFDIAAELLVTAGDNSDRVAPKPPSPRCAAPAPSPPAPVAPTAATASTAAATGRPTPPSTGR
jgi:transposase